MRSIRFKLALLMGGAALLAVLAAGGLVLALRAMDAALDRAVAAQGRLDRLAEVSGRLGDYGLAAIDSANAERADRPREARARVEASLNAVARPLLARLAEIRSAAGAIGSGELDRRLAVRSRDELGLVVAALNRMAARLARREAQVAADRAALEGTVAERTADLSAANERLSAVDRSRRRFFTDVSHELRTPLTVILGECDIALRAPGSLGERTRSVFEVIAKRAQRLHRRVEDLLRVARSESGEIELDFRRVALRPLLAAAVDSAEVAARRKGVALRLDLDAPEAEATADGERIRQIVEGLIDNALRHASGATAVTVTLAERNGGAAIAVTDNGAGFPPGAADELLARL